MQHFCVLLVEMQAIMLAAMTGDAIAWFADNVIGANKVIKAGNLAIELYWQPEG